MFVPEYEYFDLINSDQKGSFSFSGFEFPDSTVAVIQAIADKERADKTILEISEPIYPSPGSFYRTSPKEFESRNSLLTIQNKGLEKSLEEEGMRIIELGSINVVASKKKKKQASFFNLMCEKVIDKKQIAALDPVETEDLIWAFPFMNIGREQILKSLIYIVDDQEMYEDFDPNSIPVHYIQSIGVLRGNNIIILGRKNYEKTAIVITTNKMETSLTNKPYSNLKKIRLRGYQEQLEFYNPKYDATNKSSKKADFRTTIYWNPSVKVKSNEKVNLQFYTSDNPGNYSLKIEGITNKGKIIYGLHKMN